MIKTKAGLAILTVYVLLHAFNGVLLKALALEGVSTADTLIFRGLGCVVVAVFIGLWQKIKLWPKEPGLQAFRFMTSGLALWALTAAYQYANATSVAIISRLDTALLVVAGPLVGVPATKLQRVLAAICLALLMGAALSDGIGPGETPFGYFLAIAGTIGITIGYLFLRASAAKEFMPVVAWVAGAAILGYGCGTRGSTQNWPELKLILGGLISGVIMYSLYDLTVRLYKVMDVARAEYPTLFSTLLVMAMEASLLNIHFDALYVGTMMANLVLLGLILWFAPPPAEKEASE